MSRFLSTDRRPRRRSRRFAQISRRQLLLESLEHRQLLAADFQNSFNEFDVDDDGLVAPLDALLIINELNAGGARDLRVSPAAGWVDVSGDNFITPLDALLVITALNTGSFGNLVAITESNAFVQEKYYDLTLPSLAKGTRKITFDVNTRLDTTD